MLNAYTSFKTAREIVSDAVNLGISNFTSNSDYTLFNKEDSNSNKYLTFINLGIDLILQSYLDSPLEDLDNYAEELPFIKDNKSILFAPNGTDVIFRLKRVIADGVSIPKARNLYDFNTSQETLYRELPYFIEINKKVKKAEVYFQRRDIISTTRLGDVRKTTIESDNDYIMLDSILMIYAFGYQWCLNSKDQTRAQYFSDRFNLRIKFLAEEDGRNSEDMEYNFYTGKMNIVKYN